MGYVMFDIRGPVVSAGTLFRRFPTADPVQCDRGGKKAIKRRYGLWEE